MNFDMNNHNHNQNNNGLLRFRSAPSSVLQSFVEKHRDVNDGMNYSFGTQEEVDLKPNLMGGFCVNSHNGSMDSVNSYTSTGSNLFRQNSSPAGFLSNISPPNGYGGMRGTVARLGNVGNNGEVSSSSSRLKRQTSCSSRLGILPRISEIEPDAVDPGVLDDSSDYSFGSWEHQPTSHFIDNFTWLKRELDLQDGENAGNHQPILSHHMSLPKTSGEMAAVQKLLHFQDSVPCKIRAKRGCATHPRSIAERVRRTRISERMRKLQELVPHMDKQTNTSDMLDFAVNYIKDLQEQYKALKDCCANCRCSTK